MNLFRTVFKSGNLQRGKTHLTGIFYADGLSGTGVLGPENKKTPKMSIVQISF